MLFWACCAKNNFAKITAFPQSWPDHGLVTKRNLFFSQIHALCVQTLNIICDQTLPMVTLQQHGHMTDHTLSRRASDGLLRPVAQTRTHRPSLPLSCLVYVRRASTRGQQQLISSESSYSTTKSILSVVVDKRNLDQNMYLVVCTLTTIGTTVLS